MDIKSVTDQTVSTLDMEAMGDLEEYYWVWCKASMKRHWGFWYGVVGILSWYVVAPGKT